MTLARQKQSKAEQPGFDPRPEGRRGIKVVEFAVVLALFLIALIWFGGAYPNRDALWFQRVFDAQPSLVRIYHYGSTREVLPSDPDYAGLVSAINRAIAQHNGYVESLYPHDDSLSSYQTTGYAIELEYATSVQVHTRQFFPAARRLMIAIDGRFNWTKEIILFRGNAERYLPGGLVLTNIDAVKAQVDQALAQRAQ
ncbi:MAG: hypothetical protein IT317_03900 [Anaerolineales bacterium]|nr:hypothetical protein [Anaerolineales bacterium]